MATRYYFRSGTNATSGLPTTEQSSLTNTKLVDALTVNRTLDTAIGAAQATLVMTSNAVTSQQTFYFSRFVGPPIGAQTIAAATWTYNFAVTGSNANANFPVTGVNQPVRACCYVWRPSSTSLVGTIIDGNTSSNVNEPGSLETCYAPTFSGASVTTQDNDVIIFEVWFVCTQGAATAYTDTFYYNGATVTTNSTTVTNHASFIECPNTISGVASSITMTPNTQTLTNKFITKV